MKKICLLLILLFTISFTGCSNKQNKVIINVVDSNSDITFKYDNPIVYVAENAAECVVEIQTKTNITSGFVPYFSEGAGSGVIISSNGYIVTNNHVVEGTNLIKVRLKNGNEYEAEIVGLDELTDLAVIKIEEENLKPATIGKSSNLLVGEIAVAIGNPLGQLGGTVTSGIISALDRNVVIDDEIMTLLQTNAQVSPGNSGGGLFNERAELIGIVNAKSSENNVEGIGFAIPIDIALPVITDLIEQGYVSGRANFGVELETINNNIYVYSVEENKDGYNAGLRRGDIITKIDDKLVSSSYEVKQIIRNKKIGETINITVIRNYNEEIILTLKITEYKNK